MLFFGEALGGHAGMGRMLARIASAWRLGRGMAFTIPKIPVYTYLLSIKKGVVRKMIANSANFCGDSVGRMDVLSG